MKRPHRLEQIRNIGATLIPAAHRTDDAVTAYSLGFNEGLAVALKSPLLARRVLVESNEGADAAMLMETDLRADTIIRLLLGDA